MLRTLLAFCSATLLGIFVVACAGPTDNPTSPSAGPLVAADSSKGGDLINYKVYVWTTDLPAEDDLYCEGVPVTLTTLPSGQQQTLLTYEPKGEVRFQIPKSTTEVRLQVDGYEGLCAFDKSVPVGNPPGYAIRLWQDCSKYINY